ncbi:MAG: hypothetical protein ACSLE8_25155, partial [Rhodococcus sp. (in: high G+C Gram-positive bacteria)]
MSTSRRTGNLGHIVAEHPGRELVDTEATRGGCRFQSTSHIVGDVHSHRHRSTLRLVRHDIVPLEEPLVERWTTAFGVAALVSLAFAAWTLLDLALREHSRRWKYTTTPAQATTSHATYRQVGMGPDEAHHLRAIVLRRRSDCWTAALLACERVDTGPNQTPHGHFGLRRIAVRVTALRSAGGSGFFGSAQRARRLLLEGGAVHPVAWMIPLPVESVHFAVDTLPRGLDDARSDSFVGRHGRTLVDLTREVTGVVAVYLAYQRGRILARDQAAEAFANARRV